jgi:hypothetical protein
LKVDVGINDAKTRIEIQTPRGPIEFSTAAPDDVLKVLINVRSVLEPPPRSAAQSDFDPAVTIELRSSGRMAHFIHTGGDRQ